MPVLVVCIYCRGIVECKGILALGLGLVHSLIRPLEQLVERPSMGRCHGDTHRTAQRNFLAETSECIAKHIDQLAAAVFQQFLIRDTLHQYHKLVSAHPGNDILAAEHFFQNPGRLGQNRIAKEVAISIVDLFKIIQIDHQHRTINCFTLTVDVLLCLLPAGRFIQ